MAGRMLGDAYVVIKPETRLFRTLTDAQVRKELAGFNPKVRIGADTKSAQLAITSFQKRVSALSKQLSALRADATTKDAESKVAGVQARVLTLARQMRELTMTADAKKLDAQIAGEVAKLKGLQLQMSSLQADADTKKAASRILDLQKQAFHLQEALDKGKLKSDIDVKAAQGKLKSIDAELRVLSGNARALKLAADSKSLLAQIEVVKASLSGLQAQARDIKLGTNLDQAKLLASESALLGLEHIVENLGKKDAPIAGTAMGAFFSSMNRGSTAASYGWKILTGHITLMGGVFNKLLPKMFTSVAVWHLLIDAAIEVLAVWTPAIIAVTAFGVAGADAGKAVYLRMKDVHTVMDATGKSVPPLTNNFNKLAAAVRPQVYQLFGDALLIMNKRGGAFNAVATGTGRVLDQLAARFVFAVTTGSGVNKFMEHAVDDVAKLGDSIGNLGGIFGAVFRAVPGYAEILLSVGDAITKILETATQAAEPVIAVGLALHGFFIYGGLAVTVSLALVAGVIKLISAFGKFNEAVTLVGLNALKAFALGLVSGIKGAIGYSGALIGLARSEGIAAAGSIALADAQNVLTKIPTTFWVVAAAAALITLVHAIASSRDEAQKFNDTLQQTIQNAPLANVATTIQQAQAVTAAHLADSTRQLNEAIKTNTSVNAGRAGTLNSNGTAIQNLDNATRHYAEGVVHLSDQQKLVTSRFGALSKEFGGQTQALGALNLAGITTAQITDTNKDHWAQALIQVEATTAAYKAMGTQAGTLGNDLDVLGRTETDQYTATQKLNQAWNQFIDDVTGTQGTFDTVAQGFETLSTHSQDIKLSLGKLKTGFNDAKAAIDDLTPAGIALNQAFGQQVGNIEKLFESWRTAGIAGNLFTEGVKAAISPMTKYARGSQEATAQLVALAQQAGYQGPISMAALNKWLGSTHDSTKRLKDITNQATEQEALLTGAMQSQGDFIAGQLLKDINDAIFAYNGVQQAAQNYGDQIAKFGRNSVQAQAAQQLLVNKLTASGLAAGSTADQIAALAAKILGIPKSQALAEVEKALFATGNAAAVTGPQVQRIADVFRNQKTAARDADAQMKVLNDTILKNGANSDQAKSARAKLVVDLIAAGVNAKTAEADVKTYSDAILKNGGASTQAEAARKKLIQDILNASGNAKNGKTDLDKYTQAVRDNGARSDAARSARAKLITDLMNAGLSAKDAKNLVNNLQTSIDALHGKTVKIHMDGTGLYTITGDIIGASQGKGGSKNAAGGLAGGGYISMGSGPTADDVPAMLSRGELVVPAKMVQSGAVDHLRGALPGFAHGGLVRDAVAGYAVGGLVPGYASGGVAARGSGKLTPGFVAGFGSTFESAMLAAEVGAMRKDLKSAKAAAQAAALAAMNARAAGTAGGGVQRWRGTVLKALAMEGLPASLVNDVLYQMQTESGGNQYAINLTDINAQHGTPSKGLMQVIAPTFARWHWPGTSFDIYDPLANIAAALNYAAHGRGFGSGYGQIGSGHGYALGGLVGEDYATGGMTGIGTHQITGLASGGLIPLGKYLPQLKAAQGNEYKDYSGLRKAYLADLAHAKTGSWTSGHRAGIKSELGTLAKRQSAEEAAYDNILHHGTAKANLSKFATRVRAVVATSRDKDLTHSHPGWTHGLQYWLGVLIHLAQAGVAPVYGGSQVKLLFPAWIAKVKADQAHEVYDYRGLQAAFKAGLSHARKGTWLYTNRKALGERLYALAVKQNAEAAAYSDLVKHSSGSVSDLDGLSARINKLGAGARAETGAIQPSLLGHTPGGHPGWVKALQAQLKLLTSLTAPGAHPFNPPWAPGNLGPSHTAPGGVLRFDTGRNILAPGLNLAWNGTGRMEPLSRTGAGSGPQVITLEIAPGGGSEFEQFMFAMIRRFVRVNGGGSVQTAFGRNHPP